MKKRIFKRKSLQIISAVIFFLLALGSLLIIKLYWKSNVILTLFCSFYFLVYLITFLLIIRKSFKALLWITISVIMTVILSLFGALQSIFLGSFDNRLLIQVLWIFFFLAYYLAVKRNKVKKTDFQELDEIGNPKILNSKSKIYNL